MSPAPGKIRSCVRAAVNRAIARCGLEITGKPRLEELRRLVRLGGRSRSQYGQDVFVLSEIGFPRRGFFVEFGAHDGVKFSNTYLLEKELGWTGILAEPARSCHASLAANRSCIIETNCVWKESGTSKPFREEHRGMCSSLDGLERAARSKRARDGSATVYDVQTISLQEMLAKHGAPPVIDYVSIDTEGSELDILEAFDFSAYTFRTMTCEHNYDPFTREAIHDLLTRHGYVRLYQHISMCDDWYVHAG